MIILQSTISKVRRDRNFGRIEAVVSFVAKIQSGQPPQIITLRTNVAKNGPRPLRQRLLEDAARLATLMRPATGPLRHTA